MREQFEKLFPVPQGVVWDEASNSYHPLDAASSALCVSVRKHWIGFQAGRAAGLEDAALMAEDSDGAPPSHLAAAIRAMKP